MLLGGNEMISSAYLLSVNAPVHDSDGNEIQSQLSPLSDVLIHKRKFHVNAYLVRCFSKCCPQTLAFIRSFCASSWFQYLFYLSYKTKRYYYTITGLVASTSTINMSGGWTNGKIELGQGNLKLHYDADERFLSQYFNTRSLINANLEQTYKYYTGDDGSDKDPQALLSVIREPLLHEVHQKFNSWIYQVTRVYKEKEHVEVEFTIGPIPIDDKLSKEISSQIKTSLVTNKTFYADSNGRDFIKRIRDYRSDWNLQVNQPVAGNYYPINLGVYVEDDNKELSVLVDRSVGVSSLEDGQIELMLHRRLLHDDGRGVGEAFNETVCVKDRCEGLTVTTEVQGKIYIRVDPLGEGAKWRRTFGQEIYSPLLIGFGEHDGDNWSNSHITMFSAMDSSYSLPDNVALITLQALEDGTTLLRLAHLFGIAKITETNLSANQERAAMEEKRLKWRAEGSTGAPYKTIRGATVDPLKQIVELASMEIRTFIISLDYNLCRL